MTDNPFKPATKRQAKLRMAIVGPSGSGKTFTALTFATALGGKIAVIDTEAGSASKYADRFQFDVLELNSFSPDTYVEALNLAQAAGYDVIVVDSLSHAWMGKDGALEQVDKAQARGGNKFTAWGNVTPKQNALVDAMIRCRAHLIATIRSKMEYVQEKDERGKTVVRKVGMQPVQRDGLEYEFDILADMTQENRLIVSKTRCPAITGATCERPGADFMDPVVAWLSDGSALPQAAPVAAQPAGAAVAAVATPVVAFPVITKDQADASPLAASLRGRMAAMFKSIPATDQAKRKTLEGVLRLVADRFDPKLPAGPWADMANLGVMENYVTESEREWGARK